VTDAEHMDEYSVVLARSARKELEHLGEPLLSRVLRRIETLALTPRPDGCRKLQGANNLWRIRIGDHRVLYSVDDAKQVVDVIAIRHRSDAYR
jgi:mRNA interferase RelE/StbE